MWDKKGRAVFFVFSNKRPELSAVELYSATGWLPTNPDHRPAELFLAGGGSYGGEGVRCGGVVVGAGKHALVARVSM